ncbi:adenosylmethionine decarboxylase, partial [Helicosporidium sp. ATCC 50920]
MSPPVFPTPVFEGSEKRLCALFAVPPGSRGLRALPRSDLDALMTEAECQIVSARHHGSHDAYVLSESSLFVYADRLVLKTCGTTRLLSCLGPLLALVEGQGLRLRWLKFSRASYLFPERQPHPHSSFEAECELLDGVLDGRFSNSTRHVLGAEESSQEGSGRLRWHVYVAGEAEEEGSGSEEAVCSSSDEAVSSSPASDPIHTAEIIMTDLCGRAASSFFRGDDFVSAEHTTRASGVGGILPRASVDDYVFEPCGYSMNAALDAAFATSHITPEQGFSYASYEVCGRGFFPREERLVGAGAYARECTSVPALLHRCAAVFRPRQLALAVSVDAPDARAGAGEHLHRDWASLAPAAYSLADAESAVLPSGSRV